MVDTPTIDEFLERFPQFEDQSDKAELMLPEAARFVTDRWIEEDQKTAIMYALAHLLTTEGKEEAGEATGAVQSESFSIGGVSESRSFATGGGANASEWSRTEYGQRYLTLFKRSFGTASIAVF